MNLITGYYGFGNFGDDLFVYLMRDFCYTEDISFFIENSTASKLERIGRRLFNIDQYSSITLAGGSVLGSENPISLRRIESKLQKIRKFKLCAIGVGLHNSKSNNESIIKSMGFIGIRSKKDYKLIRSINKNVHYSSDLAYLLKLESLKVNELESVKTKSKEIGIVVATVGDISHELVSKGSYKDLINILKSEFGQDIKLTIYVFQSLLNSDVELANTINVNFEKLGIESQLYIHENVEDTIAGLNNSSFIITDRLHGAIIAHHLGIPFLLSNHHEKCSDFLDDIIYPNTNSNDDYILTATSIKKSIKYSLDIGKETSIKMQETAESSIYKWLDYITL